MSVRVLKKFVIKHIKKAEQNSKLTERFFICATTGIMVRFLGEAKFPPQKKTKISLGLVCETESRTLQGSSPDKVVKILVL